MAPTTSAACFLNTCVPRGNRPLQGHVVQVGCPGVANIERRRILSYAPGRSAGARCPRMDKLVKALHGCASEAKAALLNVRPTGGRKLRKKDIRRRRRD
ncbi:hypothetical protein V3C99_002022 [Haemonchus contortus]